jgi:hypothetical protein
MIELLKQGVIITFNLINQQSDELLESIRQQALVYFSQEERQKRHDSLVKSINKLHNYDLPKEIVENVKPIEMSISLLYDKHNQKVGVYWNRNKTSIFGMSNSNYYNIESMDSFHIKL